MTNEFEGQGGLNKSIYKRRKAMVEEYWQKYQASKNPEYLAIICKELPFFEHPDVGNEIARLLLKR
ncbi:hypothetical protein N9E48_09350 [Paracoccaceae bacterium]|nr:hypothetical protein [Paracoccaceae bacterium]